MCNTTHKSRGCGCGCHGGHRHYLSPEEEIEKLEKYEEELKNEQKGVEARLNELKNK